MKPLKKKARSLCKTPGGKFYLSRWIISLFPEHEVYIEPCAGGLNVLLDKPKSVCECVGDTNGALINLYRCVADPLCFPVMLSMLEKLTYAESTWQLANVCYNPDLVIPAGGPPDVRGAILYLVNYRMSRGGLGNAFASSVRTRGGNPGDVNAWLTLFSTGVLQNVHDRLSTIDEFWHGDALALITSRDCEEAVVYVDPPYLPDTRVARHVYGPHEMTVEQHVDLLNCLVGCKAVGVFISAYGDPADLTQPNPLYRSILSPAGFDVTFRDFANHSGQNKVKQRRREFVWFRVR